MGVAKIVARFARNVLDKEPLFHKFCIRHCTGFTSFPDSHWISHHDCKTLSLRRDHTACNLWSQYHMQLEHNIEKSYPVFAFVLRNMSICHTTRNTQISNIQFLTMVGFTGSLASDRFSGTPISKVSCSWQSLHPQTLRQLALWEQCSCHLHEGPVWPLCYPILLWGLWNWEFMLSSFWLQILHKLPILKYSPPISDLNTFNCRPLVRLTIAFH